MPFYAWTAVTAAAIVALAIGLSRRPAGEIDALIAVVRTHEYRVVEPRLSGGFPYKPFRRVVRSPMSKVFATGTPSAHAVGLAYLLNGDFSRAIHFLERAADGTRDTHVLTDLAAARYEHAIRTDRPADLAAAFTILTRALELDPRNAEALFTRALVLERLHLYEDAADAWRTYLGVDGTSDWAAEARENLRLLERPAAGPSVEERRIAIEEQMLAEWAAAVLANDSAAAESVLAKAAQPSELLARDGDGTARAILDRIRRGANRPALATAHRNYTKARRLYLKARDEIACTAMKSAAAELERQQSPLAARAWIYAATVSHYLGRSDEALRMLDRVRALQRGHERQCPLATGQMWWVRGLIFQARGAPEDALRAYLAARPYLEAANEATALAGISTVLSETHRYVGDVEASWTENLRALEWLLDPSVTYSRRQIVQNDTALLAIAQGHPQLAELVADRVRTRALDEKDPLFESLALLTRARALMARSDYVAARHELETAAARADSMARNGSTRRLVADIMLARAETLIETEPAAAVRYVAHAATELEKLQHRSRLPRLYLLGGRAWYRLGNDAAAERDWQAGLGEFETQRNGITDHRDRSTFTDAGRALFDELIALSVARGSDADALAIVRRARTVGLTLPVVPSSSSATSSAVAAAQRGTLVEYYILPKELLIWRTAEGKTHLRRVPVEAGKLTRRVKQFASHVRDCPSTEVCERACAEWFDLLLRPAHVRTEELWIAPDTMLHSLPFAALFDRERQRFVAQDHSVTILLGDPAASAPEPLRSVLVAVAPSAADDLPRLEAAEREAAIAAAAFPSATFLRGDDATPARFLDEIGRHDAVHFAGHALLDERQPERSLLRLPKGPVYAGELSGRLFPRTRLIVLAGCDTARGAVTTVGPLSYARAFADAGVPQVIGSLWPVDDAASAIFFNDFYAALKRGESPATAITAAQRHALTSRRLPPHAWATYQLYASAARAREKGQP